MIDENFPLLKAMRERQADENQNIIIILFVAFFILYILLKLAYDCFALTTRKNCKFVFDVLFDLHLKYKFSGQSKDTLTCLKNGVRAMLGPHAHRPAVVLLLVADDSHPTARAIATKLFQVTFAAMGDHRTEEFIKDNLFVDGSDFTGLSDFWDFYKIIKNRMKQHKMVLIYNFQAVHPHAATVLSSITHEIFCPQTQALIVLVMSMNCYHCNSELSSTRLATKSVEQTFGPGLDTAQLDDLVRTVTARAARVLPEKESALEDDQ